MKRIDLEQFKGAKLDDWCVVEVPGGCDEVRAADESSHVICEFPYGADEDPATARLVVAAPHLYRALKAAYAEIDRLNDGLDRISARISETINRALKS